MINPWREQSKVNPQRKPNRQINNEIWHALTRACLTGGEYQVILTILDRSWGFRSLSALISLKQFEESTKLTRQGIIKALKRAEERHLIVCRREGTKTTEYLFNKHYDTWIMPASQPELTSGKESQLVNQSLLDKSTTVDQTSQPLIASSTMLKETIKETIKEKGTGTAKKRSTPQPVLDIFDDMKAYLGFPGKTDKDPIPNYGKEGQFIKKMLARGFTREEILACWKDKVSQRGGDFVSMVWVNEDIGKKAGRGAHRQSSRQLPKPGTYHLPGESEEDYQARMASERL